MQTADDLRSDSGILKAAAGYAPAAASMRVTVSIRAAAFMRAPRTAAPAGVHSSVLFSYPDLGIFVCIPEYYFVMYLYRKLTIWALVQSASGLKCPAPVPVLMPFSAAQAAAAL